jgi:hypothetical protein
MEYNAGKLWTKYVDHLRTKVQEYICLIGGNRSHCLPGRKGVQIKEAGPKVAGSVGQPELFAHVVTMGIYRPFGQLEHGGDLFGAQALLNKLSQM